MYEYTLPAKNMEYAKYQTASDGAPNFIESQICAGGFSDVFR